MLLRYSILWANMQCGVTTFEVDEMIKNIKLIISGKRLDLNK